MLTTSNEQPNETTQITRNEVELVPQVEGIVWNHEHVRLTSITKRTQVLPGTRPIFAAPSC